MKVFVYGTLKGSHWNNNIMGPETVFLGPATTASRYDLRANGIPYLIPEGEFSVSGEVYDVGPDTLDSLDSLEGHPDWYQRRPVELIGGPEDVVAYFYPRPIDAPLWRNLGPDGALNWE